MPSNAPKKYFNACSTGKPGVVKDYLLNGVDPESRDSNQLTGLIWTGRKGRIEVAQVLLEHGADMNAGDIRNRTAVFHAAAYRHREYVAYLAAKGADLDIIDSHGWTALDLALATGDAKMVDLLKSLGAKSMRTNDVGDLVRQRR